MSRWDWFAPSLLSAGALILLGALHMDRTLDSKVLEEAAAASPCVMNAVLRDSRGIAGSKPWTALEVRRVREDCEARRQLAEQTKGIVAAQSDKAERRPTEK